MEEMDDVKERVNHSLLSGLKCTYIHTEHVCTVLAHAYYSSTEYLHIQDSFQTLVSHCSRFRPVVGGVWGVLTEAAGFRQAEYIHISRYYARTWWPKYISTPHFVHVDSGGTP